MAAPKLETKNKIRFRRGWRSVDGGRGLKSLFPMRDLAVMGIAEILPHLPKFLRRIKETVNAIHLSQPNAIITIDSPTFCKPCGAASKRLFGYSNPLCRSFGLGLASVARE